MKETKYTKMSVCEKRTMEDLLRDASGSMTKHHPLFFRVMLVFRGAKLFDLRRPVTYGIRPIGSG